MRPCRAEFELALTSHLHPTRVFPLQAVSAEELVMTEESLAELLALNMKPIQDTSRDVQAANKIDKLFQSITSTVQERTKNMQKVSFAPPADASTQW